MGWKFHNLTTQTAAPLATFRPAAYLFAQNTRHVIYQGFNATQGSDGHLYELYWDEEDGWHAKDLTAEAEAPLATAYPNAYIFATNGTQHVLYGGAPADGHVHELWWDDDGWHHNDLTIDSGEQHLALTVPTGYEFYAEGTQHAVYQGRDDHIYELWWQNGDWHPGDLTAVTSAPPADSAPSAFAFEADHSQHVFYRGRDGHVFELEWKAGWLPARNLTAPLGAPIATGQPTGYVFADEGTLHVNYRSIDAQIHELWRDASGWHHFQLGAAINAPLADAAFEPFGYAFNSQALQPVATQHVDYVGTDGHIHELWWDSNVWRHNDLTVAAGAPLSISSPTGYVFVEQGTQHVVYNSDSHQIIELAWTPGGGTATATLITENLERHDVSSQR